MTDDDAVIETFVEIPVGSRNKYEFDQERGCMRLDRVLYSSVHYPADYGFIPQTLSPDGDPLDVLVLAEEPVFPGCLVDARPIGLLHMRDQGADDYKIVAVTDGDPRLSTIHELGDLRPHLLKEIETFFNTYKDLDGKETEVIGWQGRDAALRMIADCRRAYADRAKDASSSSA